MLTISSSKTLKYLTSAIQAYADLIRFSKPAGTVMVFLPFAYSLTLLAYANNMPFAQVLRFLGLFAIWAFLARSLACTVNDICDRDIDGLVERTKKRPLPSGRVSVQGAMAFLAAQAIVFVAAFYPMNRAVFRNSIIWLFLIMVYPWMKRLTHWPQAWLGIAVNWGAVIAWVGIEGTLDLPIVGCLMLGLFAWTLFYDTIYAIQDSVDDAKIGIGSSALAIANNMHLFLYICASVFLVSLTAVGILNNHGMIFFAISVVATAFDFFSQVKVLNVEDPSSYAGNLGRNSNLGYVVFAGMIGDYIAAKYF